MERRPTAEGVRGAILQHCRSGLGGRALRIAVIEELRRAVRFDGYVWVLTDPVTCVGVDPLADVPGVTDLARTIRLKYATPINRWTTLADVAGLGDQAASSPLWREVQQPLGVVDVASAVFRDAHGCWGFLDLWLPEPLQPGQRALLSSVLGEVTVALRAAQADTLRRLPSVPLEHPGPATLLLDADLTIQGSTPGMDNRLRRLLPHYELIWATGWEDRANDYLPNLLGLPLLPVLHFGPDARFGTAHWKLGPIGEYAEGRPLAWIDDSLNDACREWAQARPEPTLLVETESVHGIEDAHVETLIRWTTDGYTPR